MSRYPNHIFIAGTASDQRVVKKSWVGDGFWEASFFSLASPVVTTDPAAVVSHIDASTPVKDFFARDVNQAVVVCHWHPVTGYGPWQVLSK